MLPNCSDSRRILEGKVGETIMQIEEAVLNRRSIRAYRPDPVPATVLRELVDAARWTPSAANTQPWEFTIVAGQPLQRLRERLQAEALADPIGKPEMTWPLNLPERFKERRLEIGNVIADPFLLRFVPPDLFAVRVPRLAIEITRRAVVQHAPVRRP